MQPLFEGDGASRAPKVCKVIGSCTKCFSPWSLFSLPSAIISYVGPLRGDLLRICFFATHS